MIIMINFRKLFDFASVVYVRSIISICLISPYQLLCENRLSWLGHVVGRDDEYVGKRVRRMQMEKRKRGRPIMGRLCKGGYERERNR